jgi:hypothetical protein
LTLVDSSSRGWIPRGIPRPEGSCSLWWMAGRLARQSTDL